MEELEIDNHKLMYHVNEVAGWLNGEIIAPIYVEIGPVNSCNHKCIFCALDYTKNKGNTLDKDVLISNLNNMADFGAKSIMFAGEGEPLLYKHLPEVIQEAKGFGMDIAITTNGIFFNEEKAKSMLKNLSWIKFSIDAGTNETYSKIHRTKKDDFEKLMKNIEFAYNYRKENNLEGKIGCQTLLIKENINEVEDLILKVNSISDYLVLKPYSQHPDSKNKNELNIQNYNNQLKKLSKKYSKENFKVIYRESTAKEMNSKVSYNKCYGINFFALIDTLGNVIPCNLFYEKEDYSYGNIYKNTFQKIWESERRKKVVQKIYDEGCKDCRRGCRLNFENKYLDTVKNRNLEHINFI